jgi:phosphate transport system substrate-binding protein
MTRLTKSVAVALWVAATPFALIRAGDAAAQEKIVIDGSTGTAPLVAALGKEFAAKAGVGVEIGKGLGTKARFEALAAETIDIAMASHGLKVDEVTRTGMAVHRIAMTPVVFAVPAAITVAGLSDAQLCAIYERKTQNWREVGGPDLAIAALARPDSEVDAEVVRAGVACLKSLRMPESVKVMERAGDMAKALLATPGAIGMTSATVVGQSGGKLKALALNGVDPGEANIEAGRYKLTRDAFLVTRGAPPAKVKAFIDFVKSAEGAALIRANGALPAK